MSNPGASARLKRAERPDPRPAIGNEKPPCDPRCERYATCRPDSPGWVLKKQAAANLKSTLSALRQRATRVGYVSPVRNAMPRRDQPSLCLDAAYFALLARMRAARLRRRAGENGG
jgi:hypothetical protein